MTDAKTILDHAIKYVCGISDEIFDDNSSLMAAYHILDACHQIVCEEERLVRYKTGDFRRSPREI